MMSIINDDYNDTFACRVRDIIHVYLQLTYQLHICTSTMLSGSPLQRGCVKFLVEIPFSDTFRRRENPPCVYTRGCVYYPARWNERSRRVRALSPGASSRLLLGRHTPSAFIMRRYVPTVETGNSGRVRCHTTRQIGGDAT